MKILLYITALAIASISLGACNNVKKSNSGKDTTESAPNIATKTAKPVVDSKTPAPVVALVVNYLKLKNALASDNSNDGATAGISLADRFGKFDRSALTGGQKKSFEDIAGDAKEMAEHIGKSAGKLPHQREHFDMLSKDMVDLVKVFGAGQSLYLDYCPMYNDQKGAVWLSETKEIKNPYMGFGMSSCGSVKEELK